MTPDEILAEIRASRDAIDLATKRLAELETALAKAQALILEQEAEIERLRAGQCHH